MDSKGGKSSSLEVATLLLFEVGLLVVVAGLVGSSSDELIASKGGISCIPAFAVPGLRIGSKAGGNSSSDGSPRIHIKLSFSIRKSRKVKVIKILIYQQVEVDLEVYHFHLQINLLIH